MRVSGQSLPSLLDHRGLPCFAGREHIVLVLSDLRLHQFLPDEEPALPAELIRQELAASHLVALVDDEQVAELAGSAIPRKAPGGLPEARRESVAAAVIRNQFGRLTSGCRWGSLRPSLGSQLLLRPPPNVLNDVAAATKVEADLCERVGVHAG